MGAIILDSSVLIAFLNSSDSHHMAAKSAVESSHAIFRISILTVSEVLVKACQESEKRKSDLLADLSKEFSPFFPFDLEVAVLAAAIRAKSSLRLPDAIISATATVNGATLWTCDAALAKAHPGAHLVA
jgi:predicted nucleic acid-binding protein